MSLLRRLGPGLVVAVYLLLAGAAHAGKVDELSRLLDDPATRSGSRRRCSWASWGQGGHAALVEGAGRQGPPGPGHGGAVAGRLGDNDAAAPLKELLQREKDAFVRGQVEKALASLGTGAAPGRREDLPHVRLLHGRRGAGQRPGHAERAARGAEEELSKLTGVTFTLESGEEKSFGRSGRVGFLIDGNVTRLDDGAVGGGAVEINCDVKIMVARWPSKSIILWTNAGAAVQSGSNERDKASARRDCLEAVGRLAR
jgi:hypothetical protein